MRVEKISSQSVQLEGVVVVVVRVLGQNRDGFRVQMGPEIIGPNIHRVVEIVDAAAMRQVEARGRHGRTGRRRRRRRRGQWERGNEKSGRDKQIHSDDDSPASSGQTHLVGVRFGIAAGGPGGGAIAWSRMLTRQVEELFPLQIAQKLVLLMQRRLVQRNITRPRRLRGRGRRLSAG